MKKMILIYLILHLALANPNKCECNFGYYLLEKSK